MEQKDEHVHTCYKCKCGETKKEDKTCDGSHVKFNEENKTNISPEKVETSCTDANCKNQ